MNTQESTRWCPHCAKPTANAPLPHMTSDLQRLAKLSSESSSQAVFRRYYCMECRSIWESAEATRTFFDSLLRAREEADELKRQVAMLRFMLANERRQNAVNDIAA